MRPAWLFSRGVDLGAFLGSFALSMAALAAGAALGVLHDDTPGWAWVPAIVLCDVAHVWATLFRTYLDPEERAARRALFTVVPAAGLVASAALLALGWLVFWRALAYLAIFHFVRQQYGWVALYRARAGDADRIGGLIDGAAIYAATVFPLVYWHTHLPRRFAWFVAGDVVALPAWLYPAGAAIYVLALVAYVGRAVWLHVTGRGNPGKDVVVVTTAIAWLAGIVVFDSDYAFTVTNVFMHGVPYFVLVWRHARRASAAAAPRPTLGARLTRALPLFLGVLFVLAFVEEMIWDRAVWHERAWLFGEGWHLGPLELLAVPLLALPQLTHYVLDGFVWRRRSNPSVAALLSDPADTRSVAHSLR